MGSIRSRKLQPGRRGAARDLDRRPDPGSGRPVADRERRCDLGGQPGPDPRDDEPGPQGDLVTHALIEVESAIPVQRRIGLEAVAALADLLLPRLKVVEIGRDERRAALAGLASGGTREISLVDRVSFDLMHRLGLRKAFAFDRHFAEGGFDLIGSTG